MGLDHKIEWNIKSWRAYEAKQIPVYDDQEKLQEIEQDLKDYPPLVFAGEVRRLKEELAKVASGKAFLLQGGDCAESFADFHPDSIRDSFRILMQMAIVLTYGAKMPIVKVSRTAGQFAKPRSQDTETRDGVTLPSYRGDIVNGLDFTAEARRPAPERMIRAYMQSASTLNLLRALAEGGYANLHQVHKWTMDFVGPSAAGQRYQELAERIEDALNFMEACGLEADTVPQIQGTHFYTSHESLLLQYEEAMTRQDSLSGDYVNTSAHMLWIGDRTRFVGSSHVEFLRGVINPIGMKISQSLDPDTLIRLIDALNPSNEPGKLTLITRYGAGNLAEYLPKLIHTVRSEGRHVVWSCDPMHGNTIKAPGGLKTRPFDKILQEVKEFFEIHKSESSYAGGIHCEMTGKDVTECTGGAVAITDENLDTYYETACDPRLNAMQSLELAFILAEGIQAEAAARKAA